MSQKDTSTKTVLFLYAEAMGYILATTRALASAGVEVYFVHWDKKKLTPFELIKSPNIHFINRSETDIKKLMILVKQISPEITYISGWQDRDYMTVAKWLKKRNNKVVVGFDDQWRGSLKQIIAASLGFFHFFSIYFSHAWVSGPLQFEYARRLGFKKNEIIFDLLSADLDLFHSSYDSSIEKKRNEYPHQFLFVGRFEKSKGVDLLLMAWESIRESRKDWSLHFVGNGPLKSLIIDSKNVTLSDFLQPEILVDEVINSGCFILPSRYEPWGLVIHEFAAAGLPIISSEAVGANSSFLVQGLNGYKFQNNSVEDLARVMLKIINTSDDLLIDYSKVSHELSYRISSKTSSSNFLSILS